MPRIPEFKDEQEESEFWDTHDSTQFLEETTPVDTRFSGPRPRKVHISLRLDQEMIDDLKAVAGRYGIGYQTLIRMWVAEQLNLQLEGTSALSSQTTLAAPRG